MGKVAPRRQALVAWVREISTFRMDCFELLSFSGSLNPGILKVESSVHDRSCEGTSGGGAVFDGVRHSRLHSCQAKGNLVPEGWDPEL